MSAAIATVSEERVTEAFDRADAQIDAWQLNTVPEEGDEEDESVPEDMTFLTGNRGRRVLSWTPFKGDDDDDGREGPQKGG